VLGQPHAWAEFGMTAQEGAYRADTLPSTQPVSSPVSTAADALTRASPITYAKGTSVIRQLAALIGAEAMRAGLQDYLTGYAWSDATLADLVRCWSRASGRDLVPWASQWLQQPGVNTLRPWVQLAGDDTIRALTIVQAMPSWPQPPGLPHLPDGPMRAHTLTVGCYETDGPALKRTASYTTHLDSDRITLGLPDGAARAAAIILNDTDLTFAKVRFDSASFAAVALGGDGRQ
jgi:aminopeptidase N